MESGVKLLSIVPVKGHVPIVGDILDATFKDVASLRAAVRRRWSRNGLKLMTRIHLRRRAAMEIAHIDDGNQIVSAEFDGDTLVVKVDDGNGIVETPLKAEDWEWVTPSDCLSVPRD